MEKADEHREKVFGFIRKTVLRIRDGKTNPIYLIRYSLFSCPWFAIKLHRIFISDDDCLHDHPWSFISIVLWGGYFEHKSVIQTRDDDYRRFVGITSDHVSLEKTKKWYGPGSILWRPRPSIHKLEIPEGKTATTLVITLRKQGDWGFYTPTGWKYWKDYIRSGAKCE